MVPPAITSRSALTAARAVARASAGMAVTPWRTVVSAGSLLATTTSWSATLEQNAAQSASSPGLPCPNAPTSRTVDIEHLLVQIGVAAGDGRPAPAGGQHPGPPPELVQASGSAARPSSRAARAAGRIGAASTLGAPAQRARAGDSSTGVSWARASASTPLDANGLG